MSNQITIMPTKFVDITSESTETFGVRVYDGYGKSYDNTWESIPSDNLEILKRVLKMKDKIIVYMMDFLEEQECDILIGDSSYSWEEIKHLF